MLDFGGSNGILAPTLSRLYRQVDCVGLSPEMAREIVRTQGLANVSVHDQELTAVALPAGSFDAIFAADVLEHIPDYGPLVRELRRLLVPGGELLVSAPSENMLYAVARRAFGIRSPRTTTTPPPRSSGT